MIYQRDSDPPAMRGSQVQSFVMGCRGPLFLTCLAIRGEAMVTGLLRPASNQRQSSVARVVPCCCCNVLLLPHRWSFRVVVVPCCCCVPCCFCVPCCCCVVLLLLRLALFMSLLLLFRLALFVSVTKAGKTHHRESSDDKRIALNQLYLRFYDSPLLRSK